MSTTLAPPPPPASAPTRPAPRAARRSTSLFSAGEAQVWLTGGALALCLLMIVGLLLLVVIQGGDEKARGEVQIKDLRLGAELAGGIASRSEYASQRLAQFSVPEAELVQAVKDALRP